MIYTACEETGFGMRMSADDEKSSWAPMDRPVLERHAPDVQGGRLRYVPLTIRLAAAFRDHRQLRSPNVLCQDDGQPLTRQMVQYSVLRSDRSCGDVLAAVVRYQNDQ